MKVLRLIVVLALAGCPAYSGVVPMGQDTFMVSRQAATGFSGLGNLKAEIVQDASQYCANRGKSLQVIDTKEHTGFGTFPKAEVQFRCLDAKDPELTRPQLKKGADTGIEIQQE